MKRTTAASSRATALFSILTAIALVCGLMPFSAFAPSQAAANPEESAQSSDRAQQINDLLCAGEYAEGQVVAAVYSEYAGTSDWFAARQTQDAVNTETLMDTTAATYVSATEGSIDNAAEGDSVSVVLITNSQMSTAEMLDALWDDSRILSVEPDYVVQVTDIDSTNADEVDAQVAQEMATLAAQSDGGGSASAFSSDSVSASASTTSIDATLNPAGTSAIADATAYQWGLNNDGSTYHDGQAYLGFDINSPGWNTTAKNACGVVVVMDTGIDYTNPDLDDVMMTTMDQYNADGGKYGMNVSGIGDAREVMDDSGHGTHCAGIVASEWNDFGTSGVANGCKLAAVKVYDAEGALSISSMARGYAYLGKAVDNGLNLVAVNNSWGDREMPKMMSILVTQLGEKGVISVFSAGNDAHDSDYNPTVSGSLKDNPYAIVADASTRMGTNAYNYGIATTDVMAPGKNILSTALLNSSSDAEHAHYLAETDGAPLTKDTFESTATDAVKVYNTIDEKTFTCADTDRVGTTDSTYYYEGGTSLRIASSDFKSKETVMGHDVHPVYLKIPVSQVDSIMSNFKIMPDGLPKDDVALYFQSIATVAESDSSDIRWDLAIYDNSSDFSATMLLSDSWSSKTMYESLSAPQGRNLAVDANGCVTMKLQIGDGVSAQTTPDLLLDCLSVGTTVAPYMYASGTSMAAPMVAGSAAVAALAQDVTSAPSSADAARLARERVIWLKSHVNQYDGRFLDMCSTGGQIDLSVTEQATLPAIGGAQVVGGSDPTQVLITGSNFGTATGTVKLAGVDATVVSWGDNRIVVEVPDGLKAGLISVAVTNASGTCKDAFALEIPSADNMALFEKEIALPKEFSTTSMDNTIVGLGADLYVFPQDQTNAFYQSDSKVTSGYGVFKDLWRYDEATESWTQCASLPAQLNTLSVTVHEGVIIVCGTLFDWAAGTARLVLYSYDANGDAWSALDASQIPYGAGIVDVQGQLMVIGGGTDMTTSALTPLESGNIATLDESSGMVTAVGSLQTACTVPKLATDGSDIYVAQGWKFGHSSATMVQGMQKLSGDASAYTATDITTALPIVNVPESLYWKAIHGTYSLTASDNGPLISGVLAYTDTGYTAFLDADTFVSSDGGATFTDFGKRAYRAPIYYATSATTDEWLYTMGSTAYDGDVLIMRATRIAEPAPTPTPEPQPASDGGAANTVRSLPNTGDALPSWLAILFYRGNA